MTDQQAAEILETLGRLDERTSRIDKAVNGNGQPGLAQKVEDLEASRNRLAGAGAVGAFLIGVAEWFFHRGAH
jgi:hypothetical protein